MSWPWPFTRQWGIRLCCCGKWSATGCRLQWRWRLVVELLPVTVLSHLCLTLSFCRESTTLAHSQLQLHTINDTCSQLHLHTVNYTCTRSTTLAHSQLHLHKSTILAHSQLQLHTVNDTCTQSTTLAHSQLNLHTVNYTCTVFYTCTRSIILAHSQLHLHRSTTLAHSQLHLHTFNYTCTQSTTLTQVNYTCTHSTFDLFHIPRYKQATLLHITQHSIQLMPKYILHSRTKPL